MDELSRRGALSGIAAIISAALAPKALAQSALTPDQRNEYARIFATADVSSAEIQMLRRIQESTVAYPSTKLTVRAFVESLPAMKAMAAGETPQLGMLKLWHDASLEATALDHTTDPRQSPPATFGEQLGPARASRALAIVHIAMCEAVQTILQKKKSYNNLRVQVLASVKVPLSNINAQTASVDRAVLEAGYQTLTALYPAQKSIFDTLKVSAGAHIGDSDAAQTLGERIGAAAAQAILDLRQYDGSQRPDLHAADLQSNGPLDWKIDPISQNSVALGGNWAHVTPFVIASASKYRPKPPPGLSDPAFISAFKDAKRIGGDPNAPTTAPRWPTDTVRTGARVTIPPFPLDKTNQTFKALFWGYDGTALLCAPPRLYNMVATSIALGEKKLTSVADFSYFLMLVNLTLADAAISAWDAKYFYLYARPITTIRAIDADSTPEGRGDSNWTPLGASIANGLVQNRNVTPNFPSYPSGHAVFGGALFQVLRRYWSLGAAGIPFDFLSDEYNGLNRGAGDTDPRPKVPRHFDSFTEAETENAMSRIWMGIHWQFDADAGIRQGNELADDVFKALT